MTETETTSEETNPAIMQPDTNDDAGNLTLESVSINESSRGWKVAAANVKNLTNMTQAIGKVKLENKIGTSASDLHEEDPLKTISLATQRALKSLSSQDSSRKVTFDEEKSAATDMTSPAFQCHEMHHEIFQEIRESFGITNRQFYACLGLQDNSSASNFAVVGSGDASGKSPSFFFLSPDQRYILKSCTKSDVKTLTRILSSYRDHVKSCESLADGSKGDVRNSSLLPRYIGLYKLTFPADKATPDVTLVVMTNFFAGVHQIHKKFDLKGSTYHREASEKERAKSSPVFKDLDWMKEGRKLSFETQKEVDSIRQTLEKDTLYLRSEGLIDYSLLVGVHVIAKTEEATNGHTKERGEAFDVISARSSEDIQYFGLVDVLTPYATKKKAETLLTGTLLCRPGISCQPPDKYQQRFMAFLEEGILSRTVTSS